MSNNQDQDYLSVRVSRQIFALAFLCLFSCYWPFLNGSKEFVIGDCERYYQPACHFIGESLRKGVFPLWNTHSYCGFSQVIVSSPSLFYPPNYLLYLLPFSQGKALYLLLHQFLAGIATFFLVSGLLKSRTAAIFASLSMMFCGYLFGISKHVDFVASVSMLSCCFWTSSGFFREEVQKQKYYVAAFCFFVAMLCLSGRPEISIPGILFLFLQAMGELWRQQKLGLSCARLLEMSAFWNLAVLSGVLLSAPVLLPSWELMTQSPRAHGLSAEETFRWSAIWLDWLSIVFWQPLGNLDLLRTSFGGIQNITLFTHNPSTPLFPFAFMGPAFFTLACWGFLDKKFKLRYVFLVLCLILAIVCSGDQTPILPFICHIFPSLFVLRFPVKGIIFVLMPAILVAAVGFRWVFDRSEPVGRLYFFLLFWLLVLVLGPILYYSGIFGAAISAIVVYCKTVVLSSEVQIAKHDLLNSFLITGCAGSAFTLVACLYRRGHLRTMIAFIGLLALSVAPMVYYGMSLNLESAAEGGYYEKTSALDLFLQKWTTAHNETEPGAFRIAHLINNLVKMPLDYCKASREPCFLAMNRYDRDMLMPNSQFATRWNFSSGYYVPEPPLIVDFLDGAVDKSHAGDRKSWVAGVANDYPLSRFCSLTNSKYVVTEKQTSSGDCPELDPVLFKLVHVDDFLNFRLYQVKNFGKRFYFASRINVVNQWPELLRELMSTQNNNVIDDNIAYAPRSILRYYPGNPDGSSGITRLFKEPFIHLVTDEPSRIELQYQKNAPGLLVAREPLYFGWRVFLDRKEQPLFRINLINRGLFVPEGQHTVVFQYFPVSLIQGFELAGLGALSVLILCLFMNKRKLLSKRTDLDTGSSLND